MQIGNRPSFSNAQRPNIGGNKVPSSFNGGNRGDLSTTNTGQNRPSFTNVQRPSIGGNNIPTGFNGGNRGDLSTTNTGQNRPSFSVGGGGNVSEQSVSNTNGQPSRATSSSNS